MSRTNPLPKPLKEVSRWRVIVGRLFGAGAIFFSALWLLGNAFVALQVRNGAYEGPEGLFIIFMFTGPPMVIASVISFLLVGYRRCLLAWIALGMYVLPFWLVLIEAVF